MEIPLQHVLIILACWYKLAYSGKSRFERNNLSDLMGAEKGLIGSRMGSRLGVESN